MLRRSIVTVLSVIALLSVGTVVHADAGPPPSSMAALGDSISRGFNSCGWYVDCVKRSWSTGDDATVNSHYLRVRGKNGAINGRNFNDAKTGAKADALVGQAQQAVGQQVGYVTILIGANDACTGTEAQMTPVSTYRQQIDAALATLKQGLPNAKVFIASIPDVKRLWQTGKGNFAARTAWSVFKICQSMLAKPTSTAAADEQRRDRVRQRVVDYNTQLAHACQAYGPNCRFDGNATFNYGFTLNQVSKWDYFHPNADGQRILADVTYRAGFGW